MMTEKQIEEIAFLGTKAILYEALLYPKPGLVDPVSCGAHKDMDIHTFIDSAYALRQAFYDFVKIGRDHSEKDFKEVQQILRKRGVLAEEEMNQATKGINTHKGIIYSLAFCLCALGRMMDRGYPSIQELMEEVKGLSQGILEEDMARAAEKEKKTAGETFYLTYGMTGVRGEVENGFPTAFIGLEYLISQKELSRETLLRGLLRIMSVNEDTNIVARGGLESLKKIQEKSQLALEEEGTSFLNTLYQMDQWCISKNLSPGGSADLLSIALFLYFYYRKTGGNYGKIIHE